MSETNPIRYNSVTITLHWVMALGFFLMLGSGIAMSYFELDQSLKFQMYQWHKGGGVLLLLAFGVRILCRVISGFMGHIPPLPNSFPKIERLAAKLGHLGLYAVMLLLPLSGWVMVSASVYGLPTIVFDWFEWPHIPNLQGNEAVSNNAKVAHFVLAIALVILIAGHVGAVIKHKLIDQENLLTRMWW